MRAFLWLRGDGSVLEGHVLTSATAGTFSTVGRPLAYRYVADGVTVTFDSNRASSEAQCSVDELVLGGVNRFTRAPSTVLTSFESASSPDGWVEKPYLR
ncbi:MAG: hypothetical protein Q8O67_30935 [Deltaproteobacteria bacterium]|nr:hypothetical protein [Deltaproteobacteria bacterium]